jgi:catechol-2,3-dioxygenase
MDDDRGFRVRALGEIAIRCGDLAAMAEFYERVIGLRRMTGNTSDGIVFFRIAEGFAGHTAVLALFAHDPAPETGAHDSLHHIALSLPFEEQEAVLRWYDRIGQPYRIERFGWVGWRGIFTEDPEGNTVELVAHHPDLETS